MTTPFEQDVTRGGRISLRDVLVDAEKRLAAAGVPSPAADAAALAAFVLGVPRTRLLLHERMAAEDQVRLEQLLVRRIARVPLQHIVGVAPFRRLELQVGPGVFVPRPETEVVAEAAVRALQARPAGDRLAVDLCAGSAALALALATEVPGADVHAVEVDPHALTWTRRNVRANAGRVAAAGSRVLVHDADATTCARPGGPVADLVGRVAVVVCNPPYVPLDAVPRDPEVRDHDPARALYGGGDGLDVMRGVAQTAAVLLQPGGLLVLEHGDEQGEQAGPAGVPALLRGLRADEELAALGAVHGAPVWADVRDRPDLTQRPRVTLARRT